MTSIEAQKADLTKHPFHINIYEILKAGHQNIDTKYYGKDMRKTGTQYYIYFRQYNENVRHVSFNLKNNQLGCKGLYITIMYFDIKRGHIELRRTLVDRFTQL